MKIEETNLRFRSSLVKGLQGLFQVASILRFAHFSYSVGFFFFLVGGLNFFRTASSTVNCVGVVLGF